MKAKSVVLLAFVLALGALAAALWLGEQGRTSLQAGNAVIGGPFNLVDTGGKPVTDRDFRGRYMLVLFGYARCPDVCPVELQTISDVLEKLGASADKIAPIFISVDGKRDTPQALADYMKNFNGRITALTGSDSDIAMAAKAYRVYYRKAGESKGDDYTVDHSAFLYLMDRDGHYLTHFSYNTPVDTILAVIRKKIAADNGQDKA